jgi:hypothetical protein
MRTAVDRVGRGKERQINMRWSCLEVGGNLKAA